MPVCGAERGRQRGNNLFLCSNYLLELHKTDVHAGPYNGHVPGSPSDSNRVLVGRMNGCLVVLV